MRPASEALTGNGWGKGHHHIRVAAKWAKTRVKSRWKLFEGDLGASNKLRILRKIVG